MDGVTDLICSQEFHHVQNFAVIIHKTDSVRQGICCQVRNGRIMRRGPIKKSCRVGLYGGLVPLNEVGVRKSARGGRKSARAISALELCLYCGGVT